MRWIWAAFLVLVIFSAGCMDIASVAGKELAGKNMSNLTRGLPSPGNATGQAAAKTGQANVTSLIEDMKMSVVHLNYSGESEDYYDWYGYSYDDAFSLIGSGVIYDIQGEKVYVLTNRHVVDLSYPDGYYDVKNEQVMIKTYDNISYFADERLYAPGGIDLAIVSFTKGAEELQSAQIASAVPGTGEDVYIIGMPEQLEWSVSKGIVSGIREFETESALGEKYTAIQTDAAVNEGNSGGGMFGKDGRLVGINTWKYVGYGVEGLNFAIAATDFSSMKDDFTSSPFAGAGGAKSAPSQFPPAAIGALDVYEQYDYYSEEGDWYEVSFTLLDKNGEVTAADGKGNITIKDDAGKTMYFGKLDFGRNDFEQVEGYPFYGKSAFTTNIYFSDMNKSENSDYADVTVELESNGTRMNRTKKIYLPTSLIEAYSGSGYDYDYGPDLEPIGKSQANGGVQVTLVEGGISSSYYNDYTLAIEVKNTGSKKKEVEIKEAVLVSGGKQYDASVYYTGDLGTIYPDAAEDQDLVFYEVDDLGSSATLYLTLRVIEGDSVKTLDYDIPFSP